MRTTSTEELESAVMATTLYGIFQNRDGKASDKWEHYFPVYERLFAERREQPITLLEVGVQNGGSLEVWAKYFPNARHILGVDIDPKVGDLVYEDSRIRAHVADGTTAAAVDAIGHDKFPVDIFIDDGSHFNEHVIKSFLLFFPLLKEGGIYVIEDTHTSYFHEYDSHLFAPTSMMSFFQRMSDVVNREHWGAALSAEAAITSLLALNGLSAASLDWIGQVDAITFTNSMIIIEKRAADSTGLGRRCASGTIASVVSGNIESGGKPYVREVPLDVLGYPKTTPEQELTTLIVRASTLKAQLLDAEQRLAAGHAEIKAIRSTRLGRLCHKLALRLAKHDPKVW